MPLTFESRRGIWADGDERYTYAGVVLAAQDTGSQLAVECVVTTRFVRGRFGIVVQEGEDTVAAVQYYRDTIERCCSEKYRREGAAAEIVYLLIGDIGMDLG